MGDRSVSPVGASRFERPYSPPTKSLVKNTSPTTPSSATTNMTHYSKPSSSSTMRTATTATTAPTSVDSEYSGGRDHDHALDKEIAIASYSPSPVCTLPEEPDDWFARFRSDIDLSAAVTDDCPDRATLAAVYDLPVYASDGSHRPFGSLYDPSYATHQRQMMLFVRHFYCGACQAYLKALTESITMQEYFAIPIPTSIIVIGCGKPDLIPQYKKFTGCPFPIFADPSRQLFKKLGMTISVNIGTERPEYMKQISPAAWATGQFKTINRSLKDPEGIRKRDVLRGGNPMQIGGEFLFEEGEVVWCHRMRNYRNHAEVAVIRKVLELDE